MNDAAKRVAMAELVVHKRRSRKFFDKIKEMTKVCKEDQTGTIGGLCFNFLMFLQFPDITLQDIFYYRQLTVYVFCITDLKTNDPKLYIYH